MTHLRPRHISPFLAKALSWSPSIGVMGMRQTGKSTLIRGLAKQYVTFDDPASIALFDRDPVGPLEAGPFPVALDEAQKFAPLFDAVKLVIDRKKTPGRFILSGSVRFASKRQIRESLTGRIALFELFPMTLAECHSRPGGILVETSQKRFDSPDKFLALLKKHARFSWRDMEHHLECGGLPGICFKRDPAIRSRSFENHLDTLLARDIQLELGTKLRPTILMEVVRWIAQNQGLKINYSTLARTVSVSVPTLQRAIEAMESLFLVRRLSDTYFIEDQGLATHLMGGAAPSTKMELVRFVYHELRTQVAYTEKGPFQLDAYRTRGGIEIPFIVKNRREPLLAVTVDGGETASDKSLRGLMLYKKRFPSANVLALHRGEKFYLNSGGIPCIPAISIF